MALLSMTGFGASRAERMLEDDSSLSVVCEVRTVNHRHLQAKIRLPQEFGALEPSLDKLIRSTLARGAVQMTVDVSRQDGAAGVHIDDALAARYMRVQADLAARFDVQPLGSVVELLALPGVVVPSKPGSASAGQDSPEAKLVLQVAQEALEALLSMRRTEGDAMGRDLGASAQEIARIVDGIQERVPSILERHRERLVQRVAELSGNAATTAADLAREIALLSDRLDVSEEITRLRSHLDQLRGLLGEQGPVGRKLDFLAQEFFREANTIGSKGSDSDVAHLVVDLKTHVERLREQVQNVE